MARNGTISQMRPALGDRHARHDPLALAQGDEHLVPARAAADEVRAVPDAAVEPAPRRVEAEAGAGGSTIPCAASESAASRKVAPCRMVAARASGRSPPRAACEHQRDHRRQTTSSRESRDASPGSAVGRCRSHPAPPGAGHPPRQVATISERVMRSAEPAGWSRRARPRHPCRHASSSRHLRTSRSAAAVVYRSSRAPRKRRARESSSGERRRSATAVCCRLAVERQPHEKPARFECLGAANDLGDRRTLARAARDEARRRCDHAQLVTDRETDALLAVVHSHEPGE